MKKKNKRRSVFRIVLLAINYIFSILLLLSYLSPYINPSKLWIFALLGLLYPALLIINFLFVFIWLILLDKRFAISLICILAGWNYIPRIYQFKGKPEIENNSIALVSYNVHFFQRNRIENHPEDDMKEEILEYCNSLSPDVLCFQEYHNQEGKNDFSQNFLSSGKPYDKHFAQYTPSSPGSGMLILSRFPILNRESYSLDSNRSRVFAIAADLILDSKDTLRLINVHLQSNRLNDEDFIFDKIKMIRNQEDSDEIKKGSKKMLEKLKKAFIKRSPQALYLANVVDNSPYPVIICGDFNDTPVSFAYYQLKRGLKDAFIESGKGTGQTYAGNYPSFRIDYILHSKDFSSSNFVTSDLNASDHYPISVNLSLYRK